MSNHSFKIGDKVKVTYMNFQFRCSMAWKTLGGKGEIIEIWDNKTSDWPIRVSIDGHEYGFSKEELTLTPIIGKQLEFSFMGDD